MATLLQEPRSIPVDATGAPYPGAKRYIYQAGTTTPLTVYTDSALTTAHASPQIADANGVFAPAYLPGTVTSYRRRLTNSADVLISDVDNIATGGMTRAEVGQILYPRTEAEQSASITPSDYAYPPGDVRRYGALIDGVTDDVAAVNKAFSLAGVVAYFPAGTCLMNSSPDVPLCSGIQGDGENVSILKFATGVTKGLSLTSSCVKLADFQVLGNATNSAAGIVFGDGSSGAYDVQRVRVKNWTGTGAVGVQFKQVLKSSFTKLTVEGCTTNALSDDGTGTYPTTLTFVNAVFTNATGVGFSVLTGQGLHFLGTDFESSGNEGFKCVARASALVDVTLERCWFEANYSAGNYMAKVDGSAASCRAQVKFRDTYFATSGGTAKALNATGAGAYVAISNPTFSSGISGGITIDSTAFGTLTDWNSAYDMSSVVTDTSGKLIGDGPSATYTPTVSVPTGSIGSVNAAVARFKRITVKALRLELSVSGTITGTPAYIQCSLPSSLVAYSTSQLTPASILNNGTRETGYVVPDGSGNLQFYRGGGSAFAAGTGGFNVSLVMETA